MEGATPDREVVLIVMVGGSSLSFIRRRVSTVARQQQAHPNTNTVTDTSHTQRRSVDGLCDGGGMDVAFGGGGG